MLLATASLPVAGLAGPVPVSFRNEVMAAISKAGCNLGTCHGNATGKGGFKLSLRGQDADFDFKALARDISGRRVNAFQPEQSLILVKGANQIAHEGGKKLDPKGWEYQVLRDWIAAGMPRDDSTAPKVTKLTVTPTEVFWTKRRTGSRSRCRPHLPMACSGM